MICKKTFNLARNLHVHVKRIHNKIKNHICQICELRFAKNTELDTHLKRIHDKKWNDDK